MKKIYVFLTIIFCLLLGSCSENIKKEYYTFYAMDTIINLTFYNTENSSVYAKEVENIYLKYDMVADDYNENSIINAYKLNELREATVSKELKELIEFSIEMYNNTNGYYNPFIGRLSHKWKDSLAKKEVLASNIVENELEIMNNTSIEINALNIKIKGLGNIDLGGVAKGYATSKAKEYLESKGVSYYLLNAGSSNIVLGSKANDSFIVGLSKATDTGYYYKLRISNKAISTSSIKEQYEIIDNRRYSHMLNPKTGYPSDYYDSISIIGDDSKYLDAYSTACFAMTIEDLRLFMANKNLDYIISRDNELLYKSSGVENYE